MSDKGAFFADADEGLAAVLLGSVIAGPFVMAAVILLDMLRHLAICNPCTH